MRKIFSLLIAVSLLTGILAGCRNSSSSDGDPQSAVANTPDSGKLSVVTTIFPEYDWVVNILGDKAKEADVTMLLDNGVDLHSYQPTADDIIRGRSRRGHGG